eukprot:TRINITY_DN5049_c0_g1_i1.p1 TRINITY_DN5049_c0_g1~~TRINITY_DN5049_c0_g1_i1.p1  ORF type:complete len:634 (-),score=94.72 TRINITY_DN5049_c0_g1_i1:41-1942(-)
MPHLAAHRERISVPHLLRLLRDEYDILLEGCAHCRSSVNPSSQPEVVRKIRSPTMFGKEALEMERWSSPSLSNDLSSSYISNSAVSRATNPGVVADKVLLSVQPSTLSRAPPLLASAKDSDEESAVASETGDEIGASFGATGQSANPTSMHVETEEGTCNEEIVVATASTSSLAQPVRTFQSNLGKKLANSIKQNEVRNVRTVNTLKHITDCSTSKVLAERRQIRNMMLLDTAMSFVIVANLVYLMIVSEVEVGWSSMGVDGAFLFVFVIERVIKLYMLGITGYVFGQDRHWNRFETILITFSVVELALLFTHGWDGELSTSVLRILRMGRVTKLVRMLRLAIFKDLLLMVNGIVGGLRTLSISLILITVPLYAVAWIMKETAGGLLNEDGLSASFSNIGASFFTMFRCVVGGDCSDNQGRPIFAMLSANHGWGYAFVYILSVLVMNFAIFNVIVAIYVENTVEAARCQAIAWQQSRLQDEYFFASRARELLQIITSTNTDTNVDSADIPMNTLLACTISEEAFVELCSRKRVREILCELDIAEEDQLGLFETLDVDENGILDMEEFLVGISKLRGSPRRADIIGILLTLRSLQAQFNNFETYVSNSTSIKGALRNGSSGNRPSSSSHDCLAT